MNPAVIFMTGLSGSGKTTLANAVHDYLSNKGISSIILDGDEVRSILNITLFDEATRKQHNLNIGQLASLFEKQGNIVIVALIAPYEDTRNQIRAMSKRFVEVYLSADIETCKKRDPKGLYKKALSGEIKNFTGISAPYFPPRRPELTLDTACVTVPACVSKIVDLLNVSP